MHRGGGVRPPPPSRAVLSVGDEANDSRVGDHTEAPDAVPRQRVLTTEVEDAAVTKLDRQRDGVPEGIVPDHQTLVAGERGLPTTRPVLTPAGGGDGIGTSPGVLSQGVHRTRRSGRTTGTGRLGDVGTARRRRRTGRVRGDVGTPTDGTAPRCVTSERPDPGR